MIAPRCDEHPPTPLWRELLLALVPVVAPVIAEHLLDEARARWGRRRVEAPDGASVRDA